MTQGKIEDSRATNSFEKRQIRTINPRNLRTIIAPFGISELNTSPIEAHTGEPITISFNAINTSDFSSIYPVTLKINDEVVAAEVVSLERGTTMPMEFTVCKAEAGNYKVDVNNSIDTFTVLGNVSKNEVAMNKVIKQDKSKTEVSFDPRLLKLITPVRRGELPVKNNSKSGRGILTVIDRIADGILFGLDRIGDGLVFPIEKSLKIFTAIFRSGNHKAKKRMYT